MLINIPSTWEALTHWRESNKGPLRWLRDWHVSLVREGWGTWAGSASRRAGSGGCPKKSRFRGCQCTQKPEEGEKTEPGCSQCAVRGAEAGRRVPQSAWSCSSGRVLSPGSPLGMFQLGRLQPGHPQKPAGHSPGQPDLGVPAQHWGGTRAHPEVCSNHSHFMILFPFHILLIQAPLKGSPVLHYPWCFLTPSPPCY